MNNFKDSNSSLGTEENLTEATNFSDFLMHNKDNLIDLSLSEYLNLLLQEKGLKKADVVRNSGLDKAYVYQIFSGDKTPSRDKLIALAFGLHLDAKESQRMLKIGRYSELYPRIPRDAAILFSIQRGKDIWTTDELLFKNDFPTLLAED